MLKLIVVLGIVFVINGVWLVWAFKSGNLSHRVTHDGTWDDGLTVHQREQQNDAI